MTMADELCTSLIAHGRSGRTIGIKVRLDDFTTVTRARTVETPTSDVELVTAVALRLLAEYAPPRPVRLLGVRVAGLTSDASAAPGPGGVGSSDRGGQWDGTTGSGEVSSEDSGASGSRDAPLDQLSLQV